MNHSKNNNDKFVIWVSIGGCVAALLYVYVLFNHDAASIQAAAQLLACLVSIGCVLYTVYKQSELYSEQNRLQNLPVLSVSVADFEEMISSEVFVVVKNGKLFISEEWDQNVKHIVTFRIKMARDACAFNFRITECCVKNKSVLREKATSAFSLMLVPDEDYLLTFQYDGNGEKEDIKVSILLKFTFQDVFENYYYQDLSFVLESHGDTDYVRKKRMNSPTQ